MADKQATITFQPTGRRIEVYCGMTLLEAAADVGLTINTPCGGMGTCGKCRVRIAGGETPIGDGDRKIFSQDELNDGWRLACTLKIAGDMIVELPYSSVFGDQHQIMTAAADSASPHPLRPTVQKIFDGNDTRIIVDDQSVAIESGNTTNKCYGLAFDIGTTTLVASLIDLQNGSELAVESAINPQVAHGDDVMSRIQKASAGLSNMAKMQDAVIRQISTMIDAMCKRTSISPQSIYDVVFAGNTTMQHLLAGLDVSPLAIAPFEPAWKNPITMTAAQLSLPINRVAGIYIFPVVGGFVGGDTVAGILTTAIGDTPSPSLLVDIGTNGEIVLACNGRLKASSTAAGPAMEGAGISCGMRASAGAIEKVTFDDDVQLSIIGRQWATGICGSGLIDAAAELLRTGIIRSDGRMLAADELPDSIPSPLRKRIEPGPGGQPQFILSHGRRFGKSDAKPVIITQRDIRQLQLAVGAIRAGVTIMLKQSDLHADQLSQVLIAGGFGGFVRRSSAQRIGLIPHEVAPEKIRFVGNTSLAGARWALLSQGVREIIETIARKTSHVDLSRDGDFQTTFADSMIFPNAAG